MSKHLKARLMIGALSIIFMFSGNAQQDKEEMQRKEPPKFKQLLKEMDANDDGKLSKKEIKGPLKSDFAKVDLDGDGFITEEEFKKAPKPKRRARNN